MTDFERSPVFACCGYSGAGKTTLLLALVARLRARGLSTVVLKHDAHGLDIDTEGKDTARFFACGADVLARDGQQSLHRLHRGDAEDIESVAARLQVDYDVILVEGHKSAPLPHKIWLRRSPDDRPPDDRMPFALDLHPDDDREQRAWSWIEELLSTMHGSVPTYAGILMGGQSTRMGRSKHLLKHRGRTWLARLVAEAGEVADAVILLGSGKVPSGCASAPRLPDVPGRKGPLAGMCAAMRWNPLANWLFLACDTPFVSAQALRWLMSTARPGVWAVQPCLPRNGRPQPLPGWYSFRARTLLEDVKGPAGLAGHPRALSPKIPQPLVQSWQDADTPADLRRLGLRD